MRGICSNILTRGRPRVNCSPTVLTPQRLDAGVRPPILCLRTHPRDGLDAVDKTPTAYPLNDKYWNTNNWLTDWCTYSPKNQRTTRAFGRIELKLGTDSCLNVSIRWKRLCWWRTVRVMSKMLIDVWFRTSFSIFTAYLSIWDTRNAFIFNWNLSSCDCLLCYRRCILCTWSVQFYYICPSIR